MAFMVETHARATMPADIDQRMDLALLISGDDQRVFTQFELLEISRRGNLARMACVQPAAEQQLLQLQPVGNMRAVEVGIQGTPWFLLR